MYIIEKIFRRYFFVAVGSGYVEAVRNLLDISETDKYLSSWRLLYRVEIFLGGRNRGKLTFMVDGERLGLLR